MIYKYHTIHDQTSLLNWDFSLYLHEITAEQLKRENKTQVEENTYVTD